MKKTGWFLGVVIAGLIVWTISKQVLPEVGQSELPPVTSLDPNATNFSPKVLILSGKIWNSTPYLIWCGNRFELAIIGSTNYYLKEWRGEARKENGSGYNISLISGDFGARTHRRWLSYATQGGGGGLSPDITIECLARRLWTTNGFIGARPDELAVKQWNKTEDFSNLEKFGPYLLPRKIITTETFNPGQVLTREYTVETIIFSDEPTLEWLDKIKETYFKNYLRAIEKPQTNATPSISDVITNKI